MVSTVFFFFLIFFQQNKIKKKKNQDTLFATVFAKVKKVYCFIPEYYIEINNITMFSEKLAF